MSLSVIIPVYKVENTLQKCLESVVSQNYPNLEIILVDDGGTDKCPEMCDNLARFYNHDSARYNNVRIVVIHKMNGGLSSARNSGLDAATGDYVTFVDSDDFIGPETYIKLMDFIGQHPDLDIVEYCVAERYNVPRLRSFLMLKDKIYDDVYDYWFDTEAFLHTYSWNKIYKRCLFDEVRFTEGLAFEDIDIMPRLLNVAKRVATTSIGVYYYSWNNDGITVKAGRRELIEHLLAGVRSLEWVPKEYRKTAKFVNLYASVLNVQIEVFERTGGNMLLPVYNLRTPQIFKAYKLGLSKEAYLKIMMLRLLKLKRFCKLWRLILTLRPKRF